MAKYDLDVIARILLNLLQGPMGRTQLYMRTKLNYPRFLQYLEFLKEKGLLAEADGAVRLTVRGYEVAKALEKALDELL
ncbi:winged helix-turn-helix domain-containing protein [Pyrobaculum aerophilum]|uniref:Conserved within P. aerophilum n=2 Tax=Pyrobaculum aerophilum TaxID=13773 RepID=Q8ZYU9_PYRAE|nr:MULTISPECIES: winged helix-turn-helix domain-containing protein [Pyrobaculum]AAL62894.1 conserved within P. aerophilum [Pyrobaculum aerophilum str. IM2]MCX8135908.1 winged helix-turn-helix domain-containing protein [Pyrobaculum aerophilum]HII46029.1 hypothetical protein [Pyrobaculum aerophilum]